MKTIYECEFCGIDDDRFVTDDRTACLDHEEKCMRIHDIKKTIRAHMDQGWEPKKEFSDIEYWENKDILKLYEVFEELIRVEYE